MFRRAIFRFNLQGHLGNMMLMVKHLKGLMPQFLIIHIRCNQMHGQHDFFGSNRPDLELMNILDPIKRQKIVT